MTSFQKVESYIPKKSGGSRCSEGYYNNAVYKDTNHSGKGEQPFPTQAGGVAECQGTGLNEVLDSIHSTAKVKQLFK